MAPTLLPSRLIIACCALGALGVGPAVAQRGFATQAWASGNLGIGVFRWTYGGQLTVTREHLAMTLRYQYDGDDDGSPEWLSDTAVLVGHTNGRRAIRYVVSGGFSLFRGRRFSNDPERVANEPLPMHDVLALAVPVQVEGLWAVTPYAGIGLTAFGSVNTKHPFAGLVLALHVGKLR